MAGRTCLHLALVWNERLRWFSLIKYSCIRVTQGLYYHCLKGQITSTAGVALTLSVLLMHHCALLELSSWYQKPCLLDAVTKCWLKFIFDLTGDILEVFSWLVAGTRKCHAWERPLSSFWLCLINRPRHSRTCLQKRHLSVCAFVFSALSCFIIRFAAEGRGSSIQVRRWIGLLGNGSNCTGENTRSTRERSCSVGMPSLILWPSEDCCRLFDKGFTFYWLCPSLGIPSSSFPFQFVPLQRRGCLVAPLFLWIVLVPCGGD
jgi:hypothetical protein